MLKAVRLHQRLVLVKCVRGWRTTVLQTDQAVHNHQAASLAKNHWRIWSDAARRFVRHGELARVFECQAAEQRALSLFLDWRNTVRHLAVCLCFASAAAQLCPVLCEASCFLSDAQSSGQAADRPAHYCPC
jgi:hypothetical protein